MTRKCIDKKKYCISKTPPEVSGNSAPDGNGTETSTHKQDFLYEVLGHVMWRAGLQLCENLLFCPCV